MQRQKRPAGSAPSPRDTAAVKSWCEAGVDFETIWRCFREKVSDSGLTDGSGRRIRTLRYFHDVVMEAHRLVLQLRGPWARDPPLPSPDPEERAPAISSQTWDGVLARLKAEMESEEWETWFGPLAAQEESEGRLVIQAPNEHFVHTLTHDDRLRPALRAAAQGTSIWVTDGWREPEEVLPC